MNRKLCLLFLVCLAAVLVKSEPTIEVDENGDEYEVKKFNIQGRQLNEGRSQCVVTRRKRSTQPMYAQEEGLNDEVDDKNDDGDTMLAIEQQNVLYYSPPTLNPTADGEDEDEKDEQEEGGDDSSMNMNMNMNENKNTVKEGEEEEEDDTIEVVQLPQLPVLGQLQSDGESVAAIASAGNGNKNGIVLIQSHTPPKVNPDTHAVFELVPVNQSAAADDEEDDDENEAEDNVDDNFDFKEELSPVTTTAIWSTGDDSLNDLYDDLDKEPIKAHKITRKTTKPLKSQKRKKNSSMKPKRKNKKQFSTNKRRLTGSNNKRRNTKKRPNRTSVRRPIRKRKLRRGYTTRGRPQTNRRQNNRPQNSGPQQNNNKNSNNSVTKNKNKHSNNNKHLVAKKRKNKKHAEVIDQGSNTFTRTMTMTQTGGEDDDKNVNCIIIRKDPPPTTPRPFWNILGRNANGVPIATGHYGKRKRANVRFVA